MKNEKIKSALFTIGIIILIALFFYSVVIPNPEAIREKEDRKCFRRDTTKLTEENVKKFIAFLNMDNSDVVFIQCKIESNNMTSKLALDNNNLLGMKHPGQRPNLSHKESHGYATYISWQYCLIDYAIWQSRYAYKYRSNETEYINFLERIYAEDTNYVKKVNKMLYEYRKHR